MEDQLPGDGTGHPAGIALRQRVEDMLCGQLKALVAVARSILIMSWHLLAKPATRVRDLGPDYHTNRVATQRRLRNHIAQLTAMGYRVTIESAAA